MPLASPSCGLLCIKEANRNIAFWWWVCIGPLILMDFFFKLISILNEAKPIIAYKVRPIKYLWWTFFYREKISEYFDIFTPYGKFKPRRGISVIKIVFNAIFYSKLKFMSFKLSWNFMLLETSIWICNSEEDTNLVY